MHVALVGPCAPGDLVDLLDDASASAARSVAGYRGIPVSELARALVNEGHTVSVATLTYRPEDAVGDFVGPRLAIRVARGRTRPRHHLPDLYAQERREMAGFLKEVRPDIVHAHWTYEFELAAQDSGLPHVTTAHDAPITILRHVRDPYRLARLAVSAKAVGGIRELSVVSPYLATRWRREMRYRRRILTIPNSVPHDVAGIPRRPSSQPVILVVADASRLKNVRGLLLAFQRVRDSVPSDELRLVGPGLEPNSQFAARAGGLRAGVSFVGPLSRDALVLEYQRAWVMAHSSLEEACPMVLLEAHGAGLPAIGGRGSGGVPYVLGDGQAGWLVDVTSQDAFATTILELVGEAPPKPKPATAEFVDRIFSPAVVANQYLSWYESTLARS